MPAKYGTSVWVSHQIAEMIRLLAAAEDRPGSTIIERAIEAYAKESAEYQAAVTMGVTKP